MEFTITSEQLLGLCAFVTAVWGVWKTTKEESKPSADLKKEVDEHSRLLESDNKRLKEVEESNRLILQSLLVIVNHEISGNGIDGMKKTRDELQEYLVNR